MQLARPRATLAGPHLHYFFIVRIFFEKRWHPACDAKEVLCCQYCGALELNNLQVLLYRKPTHEGRNGMADNATQLYSQADCAPRDCAFVVLEDNRSECAHDKSNTSVPVLRHS